MAKNSPSRVLGKICGKRAMLHKLVFEVKYRSGYLYLDRCGRTLNVIEHDRPGWLVVNSPNSGTMLDAESGTSLSFGAVKSVFAIEGSHNVGPLREEQVERYVSEVDAVHALIEDELGLKDYIRIGFRCWYLLGTSTAEEATAMLLDLIRPRNADNWKQAFAAEIENLHTAITLKCEDRNCRVGFTRVTRANDFNLGAVSGTVDPRQFPRHSKERLMAKLQRERSQRDEYPPNAVQIDADFFIDDPDEVQPRRFITEGLDVIIEKLNRALELQDK